MPDLTAKQILEQLVQGIAPGIVPPKKKSPLWLELPEESPLRHALDGWGLEECITINGGYIDTTIVHPTKDKPGFGGKAIVDVVALRSHVTGLANYYQNIGRKITRILIDWEHNWHEQMMYATGNPLKFAIMQGHIAMGIVRAAFPDAEVTWYAFPFMDQHQNGHARPGNARLADVGWYDSMDFLSPNAVILYPDDPDLYTGEVLDMHRNNMNLAIEEVMRWSDNKYIPIMRDRYVSPVIHVDNDHIASYLSKWADDKKVIGFAAWSNRVDHDGPEDTKRFGRFLSTVGSANMKARGER